MTEEAQSAIALIGDADDTANRPALWADFGPVYMEPYFDDLLRGATPEQQEWFLNGVNAALESALYVRSLPTDKAA